MTGAVAVTVSLQPRDYQTLNLIRTIGVFASDADVMKMGLWHLARHFDLEVGHEDFAPDEPQLSLFGDEARS